MIKTSILALFTLAVRLSGGHISAQTCYEAAQAASDAVGDEPMFEGEDRFWVVQEKHEGSFQTSPHGWNDKHLGGACGVVQINRWMIPVGFGTCEDLRASRERSIAAGRELLRGAIARCGSVRAGLGALFTSGKCGGAPKMVRDRLREAEVSVD